MFKASNVLERTLAEAVNPKVHVKHGLVMILGDTWASFGIVCINLVPSRGDYK